MLQGSFPAAHPCAPGWWTFLKLTGMGPWKQLFFKSQMCYFPTSFIFTTLSLKLNLYSIFLHQNNVKYTQIRKTMYVTVPHNKLENLDKEEKTKFTVPWRRSCGSLRPFTPSFENILYRVLRQIWCSTSEQLMYCTKSASLQITPHYKLMRLQ